CSRLGGNGLRFAKNIQRRRRGGHHVRVTEGKWPGRATVEAPAAINAPLLRLLVNTAAVRAMHKSGRTPLDAGHPGLRTIGDPFGLDCSRRALLRLRLRAC